LRSIVTSSVKAGCGEEAQDVGGPEPGHRDQIVAHRLEHAALLEQQVGGVLALVDHPPV